MRNIKLMILCLLITLNLQSQPKKLPVLELVYNNIWGTIYYPTIQQCDKTPTITGSGHIINPKTASSHRWIAISQELLYSPRRAKLLKDSTSVLYKGRLRYGDTIWIKSQYKEINGWWVVHDSMNSKYRKGIDFLQTENDGTLYKNNKLWKGKFKNIEIYRMKKYYYKNLNVK